MSMRDPSISELHPVEQPDGTWMIHDKFGPWDGPYVSSADCWYTINMRAEMTSHYQTQTRRR